MAIEVRVPTILRQYTDGQKAVECPGDTLADLFAEDGQLNRYVNVYLNDEDVRVLDGLETPVQESDTLVILPAMAGGSR